MKKILLLFIFFLLTGCTVNYNLEIDKNYFKENINGDIKKSEYIDDNSQDINMYNYLINVPQNSLINSQDYFYNKNIKEGKTITQFNYSYTYNDSNFKDNRLLNECFSSFIFENRDDSYFIMLSGKYTCPMVNDIEINIKTDNEVISQNANSKHKNVYTYHINKSNKDDINFHMTLSKDKEKNNKNVFSTVFTVILLLITILIILFTRKLINKYE